MSIQSIDTFRNRNYPRYNNKWGDAAKETLNILIEYAYKEETITYTTLAEILYNTGTLDKLYRGYSLVYLGRIAGVIGDYFEDMNYEYPPINSILVRKDIKIPGVGCDSYIEGYLKSLGKIKYQGKPTKIKRKILEEKVWTAVYAKNILDKVKEANP